MSLFLIVQAHTCKKRQIEYIQLSNLISFASGKARSMSITSKIFEQPTASQSQTLGVCCAPHVALDVEASGSNCDDKLLVTILLSVSTLVLAPPTVRTVKFVKYIL